ncbi:MAG TPA: molecular chaperone DnaJ [Gemmatimonadales bacterium]|nr:molecular chaperone DnaJ [Gemmatimonadales bacterium]
MSEFYSLLGISREASDTEIKKAYRKLAMEYHPDRNPSPQAEAKFKEITEAYEVLRDPQKRAMYDRYGRAGLSGAGGGYGFHHVDLSEALNIFMRDFGAMGGFESLFGGRRSRTEERRGQDIRVTVRLTLSEVALGAKKTVKLKSLERCQTCEGSGAKPGTQPTTCSTCNGSGEVRRATRSMFGQFISVAPCPTCGGEGRVISQPCEVCRGEGRVRGERSVTVDIPAGVSTNNYLTLRGQGAAGPRNGPNGDLLVMLDIKDDERFERQGDDLVFDLPVSFSQAALGGDHEVPTPYGKEQLRIPPGTQPETVLRIRGKGLPILGQDGKGDLLVRVRVWTPEHLSEEQERLFRELAKLEGEPPKRSPGFWSKLKEALGA